MGSKKRKPHVKRRAKVSKAGIAEDSVMLAMDFSDFADNGARELDHFMPKLRFGSVQMVGLPRDANRYKANVEFGQAALQRTKYAFIEPGITLDHHKDVPVFVADAYDPSVLIRTVDGREERVRLVGGTFVPAE